MRILPDAVQIDPGGFGRNDLAQERQRQERMTVAQGIDARQPGPIVFLT